MENFFRDDQPIMACSQVSVKSVWVDETSQIFNRHTADLTSIKPTNPYEYLFG